MEMIGKRKLGTKIMVLVIGCIVVPTLVMLLVTHIKSKSLGKLVYSEIKNSTDSGLTSLVRGIHETIEQTTAAVLKSNCLGIARNAKEGVAFFHDQYLDGLLNEDEAKKLAAQYLLSQKIGSTGYIYVISKTGEMLVHPKTSLVGTDMTKYGFVRDQLALKDAAGYLEYMWKNPGENEERAKCLGQEIFDPWGWIISASSYRDEFARIVKSQVEISIRKMIMAKKVGATGYVFILGGKGDQRGRYIVSKDGERDGEDIWGARDSNGNLFVQATVGKGLALGPGETATVRYPWKNRGEQKARMKIVRIAYYSPWDWVIGAGAYEDEIEVAAVKTDRSFREMMTLISLLSLSLTLMGGCLGLFLVRSITGPLNRAIEALTDGAEQVGAASEQVAAASQELAEGASEQAASLEETTSALEEMASMTKQSSENAFEADNLMKEANGIVERASVSMEGLTRSMEEINRASEETSKIIKTIDEIAFQTNLLALNAAVEAARAGEAGAGFAVVADEVRNLAMRAAEAARDTSGLIEGTIKRVREGSVLVGQTSEEFSEVTKSTGKVGELVGDIAAASHEQAQGIEQVSIAAIEMDKITQAVAANAEEAASASEEMNAQAEQMVSVMQGLASLIKGEEASRGQVVGKGRPDRVNRETAPKVQGGKGKNDSPARSGGSEVGPEKLIPMGDDFFRDFRSLE